MERYRQVLMFATGWTCFVLNSIYKSIFTTVVLHEARFNVYVLF